jgi:hypothetical protein
MGMCGCQCEQQIQETGEFPSPLTAQISVPVAKLKNRFHAEGYDLCIEDVMLTIAESRRRGFKIVNTI